MNNLSATLSFSELQSMFLDKHILNQADLSSAIIDLDNRLSDMTIDPALATSSDIISKLSTIISRFGGM